MLAKKKNTMLVNYFERLILFSENIFFLVKHVLNPLGVAKYELRQNDNVIADVKCVCRIVFVLIAIYFCFLFRRKFNIGGKKFKVQSKFGEYSIEGSFRSREFKIKQGPNLVATISKKFFAIGDEYGIKIQRQQDHAFIISLAIVIDEVAHD